MKPQNHRHLPNRQTRGRRSVWSGKRYPSLLLRATV